CAGAARVHAAHRGHGRVWPRVLRLRAALPRGAGGRALRGGVPALPGRHVDHRADAGGLARRHRGFGDRLLDGRPSGQHQRGRGQPHPRERPGRHGAARAERAGAVLHAAVDEPERVREHGDRVAPMRRRRAQVLIIFAAALLPILGFLGLAVDGMYYFIALRGVSTAAGIAARAAAMDVQYGQASALNAAYYAKATPDAQAIGQQNLSQFRLTHVNFDVAYNNTINAVLLSLGWSSATPTALTNSVKVSASGTYNTIFLRLIGISTVDIGQTGVAKVSIVAVPRALPFGICK